LHPGIMTDPYIWSTHTTTSWLLLF
jgi:hypothetical protein